MSIQSSMPSTPRPSQPAGAAERVAPAAKPFVGPGDGGEHQVGEPGQFPYTRGIHRDMYRGRLWTMRQFAGFGSAEDTNQRFKFLLEKGQTGLSTAFDCIPYVDVRRILTPGRSDSWDGTRTVGGVGSRAIERELPRYLSLS